MLPLFRSVALASALVWAAGPAVASGPADAAERQGDRAEPAPMPPPVVDFSAEELAEALLQETNRVRLEHGRRPLRRRWQLEAAATDQANFMALTGRVQHASAIRGQATPSERVRRRGLRPRLLSENVAAHSLHPDAPPESPRAVAAALVAQWMDSPPHRVNLLSRDFSYFGGAIRFAPVIRRVWAAYAVQVFAAE